MSLDSSGRTCKQEAETPVPFMDVISRSVVAWVDFIADDPLNELPVVAAQLGFSEQFVSTC
jgi:hypothetical protein